MEIILPEIKTTTMGLVPGFHIPEKKVVVDEEQLKVLVLAARQAAQKAYSPLAEKFSVGASLIMADDSEQQIFSSANIENSVFNAGTCAERGVLNYIVGQGFKTIKMMAISTDHRDKDDLTLRSPCGLCRQSIYEFSDHDTLILIDRGERSENICDILDIDRLLPFGYRYAPKK